MKYKEAFQLDISDDLSNELRFLIQEVKYLYKLVNDDILELNYHPYLYYQKHIHQIDSQKSRIDSLAFEGIQQLNPDQKEEVLQYRSLIKLTRNLEKIAEFFIQAASQLQYIKNKDNFEDIDLCPFFDVIGESLDLIYPAFTQVDTKLAEQLSKNEQILDELYIKLFEWIQTEVSKPEKSADMLTLLFINRYFERMGDKFLKIAEGIINNSIGESLSIKHYERLKEAVKVLSKGDKKADYTFTPFLFSKSGCKVGKLEISSKGNTRQFFYKQGATGKIQEEIDSLKRWNKSFPGLTPHIMWESKGKTSSTLVVNRLNGTDLLQYSLGDNSQKKVLKAADLLCDQIDEIWTKHTKKSRISSSTIRQIKKRESAILKIHKDFYQEVKIKGITKPVKFNKLIDKAALIEKLVKTPVLVLAHGDFNLDNIFYNEEQNKIYFIDTHRSDFKDYAQEIAVFIVSALRTKVEEENAKEKLNALCKTLFEFGINFSRKQNDQYFQARLALGLFRSFITSTRFQYNDEWYNLLRKNAILTFEQLESSKKNLKDFKFNLDLILHH